MEESIKYLEEQFELPNQDIRSYSPLTLAYIGDAIYDLYIRTIIVKRGNTQPSKLHKRASALVKAETQADMVNVLEPHFTPEGCMAREGLRDAPGPLARAVLGPGPRFPDSQTRSLLTQRTRRRKDLA